MTDKVRKVFEILGIEPNEEFKIKQDEDATIYMIDNKLRIKFYADDGELLFSSIKLFDLLNDTYKIVKLPKKKKLRDITPEEFKEWTKNNCNDSIRDCRQCPFLNVYCYIDFSDKSCWVNHKGLYSDKFLDQEIEAK